MLVDSGECLRDVQFRSFAAVDNVHFRQVSTRELARLKRWHGRALSSSSQSVRLYESSHRRNNCGEGRKLS